MKTLHAPQRFVSDYDRVMGRSRFTLQPWMIAVGLFLAVVLVSVAVVSTGKWVLSSLDIPVLTFNPYDQVVKVTEADGKSYTRETDAHFNERVQKALKSQYDKDYTGRLDGKP